MALAHGIAILILMSLVASSSTVTATTIDRPSWTAGDFWTYQTNTTVIPGLNLTGTATSTVAGTLASVTGGSTIDAYRVVLAGSGSAAGSVTTSNGTFSVQGSWILTGEERLEPVDLHPIYSLLDLSVNGTYDRVFPFSLRFQNTTAYRILSDSWGYPLEVGTSGSVTASYNFTQDLYSPIYGHLHDNGTGRTVFGFSLAAGVSVATAAGTFQAYPVREELPDRTWQRLYYSANVGNNVRTETHDRDGNLTAIGTLVAYRYQAAEPPTFLGLTVLGWSVVAPTVAGVVLVVALLLRRRGRKRATPGKGVAANGETTSGPRGP